MKFYFFFFFFLLILGGTLISAQNEEVRGVVIQEPLTTIIITNQTIIGATDTNATTECSDTTFLRGDGTCQTFASAGDTNETNRFQNLTSFDCASGFVVDGIFNNGTVSCVADSTGTSSNIFNQDLNTTNDVVFANITITTNTTSQWFNGLFNWTLTNVAELYLTFTGGVLDFDESQLNTTIDDRLIQNETNRFQNLTTYSCQGTDKVTGVFANGTVTCSSVAGGGDFSFTDFQASFDLNITILELLTSTQLNDSYRKLSDTINENNISDLSHTTDTNETNRLQNITSYDCSAGQFVIGFQDNATVICAVDQNTGASNIFDQELNTTKSVTFNNLTITLNLTVLGNVSVHTFTAQRYLASPPNGIGFNLYDDGSELFLNASDGDAFNIETSSAKLILFDNPNNANDWKLFQVFNKMATVVSEFVVTQAGAELTSYFIRSLSLVGNGSVITSPQNCSTFAQFIDCDTDLTGPDFFVLDDIEVNGSIFVQEIIQANNWSNVSIIESQIKDLVHTIDTNETNRLQNITTYQCQGTNKAIGFQLNGTIICSAVTGGGDFSFIDFQNSFNINVTGAELISSSQSNSSINEKIDEVNTTTNIENLGFVTGSHTIDTNETNRLQNITSYDCQGTNKVTGFQNNGTVICGADLDTGGTNTWEFNLSTGLSADFFPITDSTFSLGSITKWFLKFFVDEGFFGIVNATEGNFTTLRIAGVEVVSGTHTIDTNETNRLQNLTTYSCSGTNKVTGIFNNGTVTCATDVTGATTNIFNQELNTTQNVQFANLTILNDGNVTLTGNLTFTQDNRGTCWGIACEGSTYWNGSTLIIKVT